MQQIPFIDLFKAALHVSGDKLAHPQDHFLTVYTAFGTVHRYCCRPVGSNIGALYQKLCIVKKCSWGWESLSPETCRADLKRSINGICCILLVAYIVTQMCQLLCALWLRQSLKLTTYSNVMWGFMFGIKILKIIVHTLCAYSV